MHRILPISPVERYFSLHYAPGLARRIGPPSANPLEDVCIARHHNGLCVICLSPRHPIITAQKSISSVHYRVQMRQVKGKRKKGGIVVEERTKLCTISCAEGDSYSVQCGIKGTLMEYNEALQQDSSLLLQKPLSDGYLAVVLPWANKIRTAVDTLVTADDYARGYTEADTEADTEA